MKLGKRQQCSDLFRMPLLSWLSAEQPPIPFGPSHQVHVRHAFYPIDRIGYRYFAMEMTEAAGQSLKKNGAASFPLMLRHEPSSPGAFGETVKTSREQTVCGIDFAHGNKLMTTEHCPA